MRTIAIVSPRGQLTFNRTVNQDDALTISMQFKTFESDTLLLVNEQEQDSFKLFVQGALYPLGDQNSRIMRSTTDGQRVVAQWARNRLLHSVTVACARSLADGEWHLVDVVVAHGQHDVRVDLDRELCTPDTFVVLGECTFSKTPVATAASRWPRCRDSATSGELAAPESLSEKSALSTLTMCSSTLRQSPRFVSCHEPTSRICQNVDGVIVGGATECDICANGGRCRHEHDGYSCDCSSTPFVGLFCDQGARALQ